MKCVLLSFFVLLLWSCEKKDPNVVIIQTNFGDIKVRLYEQTPGHRDNFLKLIKEGYYEGILFHRVIPHFMIQAGDPDSKHAQAGEVLGGNSIDYVIDAEIRPEFFHKKGALAAAREGDEVNPLKKSSGSHFYIVQGKVFRPSELDSLVVKINDRRRQTILNRLKKEKEVELRAYELMKDQENLNLIEQEINDQLKQLFEKGKLTLTEAQKEAYTTVGGVPHLDGDYTVFGEVIEGQDIVDRIAALKRDERDRPLKDAVILKMK